MHVLNTLIVILLQGLGRKGIKAVEKETFEKFVATRQPQTPNAAGAFPCAHAK